MRFCSSVNFCNYFRPVRTVTTVYNFSTAASVVWRRNSKLNKSNILREVVENQQNRIIFLVTYTENYIKIQNIIL